MLTRLEADGFKNLLGFSVDFGPFNCIAGPNGVGKSNIFDAIRFLSLLTDHTITEAGMQVRGDAFGSGGIRDLFWRGAPEAAQTERPATFRIAAEMIVPQEVIDDFGRHARATSTYLRYEIEIGLDTGQGPGAHDRMVLREESLRYFTEDHARGHLPSPLGKPTFRKAFVKNERRTSSGYITTHTAPDGLTEIHVHQDGGSRGQPQKAPAATAPRTIVATSNTTTTPTILAARREMQRWRFIALEPTALRSPDRFDSERSISASGAHIPATLHRLASEFEEDGQPRSVFLAGVARRLSDLAPISAIDIDVDESRRLLTLKASDGRGPQLPAASLSDGTLRFLALSVLLADHQAEGLICIEEPENGIHPGKMEEMADLLRELAIDATYAPGPNNPFRQVIVATHSPAFVTLQKRDDLLFAVETLTRIDDGQLARTLQCRALSGSWRAEQGNGPISKANIIDYLTTPTGAQLSLDADDAAAARA